LRDAVRIGRLAPGLPLPSSRALAADLGIARNTVVEAYTQLVAEGWLTAERGTGTRVADRAPAVAAATVAPGRPPALPRYDLRPGSPDVSAFPRQAWLAATRRALTAAPADALGYCDPRGRPELRQALAGYLARARGVQVTPDRVVVCSGYTQGLALLCQVLRARGATVLAVEAVGQATHRNAAVASGLAVDPLPVDSHGAVISQLGRAAAVLLTPAHQFPFGAALAPQRRHQVIDGPVIHRGHRDDLLREHVERVTRHDRRLDPRLAHPLRDHRALEQVGAELGEDPPARNVADRMAGAADALQHA